MTLPTRVVAGAPADVSRGGPAQGSACWPTGAQHPPRQKNDANAASPPPAQMTGVMPGDQDEDRESCGDASESGDPQTGDIEIPYSDPVDGDPREKRAEVNQTATSGISSASRTEDAAQIAMGSFNSRTRPLIASRWAHSPSGDVGEASG